MPTNRCNCACQPLRSAVFVISNACLWPEPGVISPGSSRYPYYTSRSSCVFQRANQFNGNDEDNSLSTALSEDSGQNIAITSTTDGEATGLGGDDTFAQVIPPPILLSLVVMATIQFLQHRLPLRLSKVLAVMTKSL